MYKLENEPKCASVVQACSPPFIRDSTLGHFSSFPSLCALLGNYEVSKLGNSWKLLETLGNSWKLLETPGNSWKLLETLGNSWKLLETGTYLSCGNLYKFHRIHYFQGIHKCIDGRRGVKLDIVKRFAGVLHFARGIEDDSSPGTRHLQSHSYALGRQRQLEERYFVHGVCSHNQIEDVSQSCYESKLFPAFEAVLEAFQGVQEAIEGVLRSLCTITYASTTTELRTT